MSRVSFSEAAAAASVVEGGASLAAHARMRGEPGAGAHVKMLRLGADLVSGSSSVQTSQLVAAALITLAAVARAAGTAPTENARIEYLLGVVASLHDARFIRNGSAYDSAAAVDHMRTKLRIAGSHVKTAEDFIRYCASESSVSGKPYEIRFADGRVVYSADFLRQKLREFDKQREGPD